MRSDPPRSRLTRPFRFRHFLAAVAALALPSVAAAIPYVAVVTPNQPFQPLPIGGGTATVVGAGYDTSWIVNMPPGFTYKFYEHTFSSIIVGSNGYVTFTQGNNGNIYSSWAFPSANAPKDILALWWYMSQCHEAGAIKSQVIGTAPSRQVVIEWHCQYWNSSIPNPSLPYWEAQLWLTEGSSTMKVHYGTYPNPGSVYSKAIVGIQNKGTGTEYTNGLPCGSSCNISNWPTNTTIVYSQGPELGVKQVTAPEEGFAGLPVNTSAVVANTGGEPATGFTLQFWVSPVREKTVDSKPLGIHPDRRSIDPGQATTFDMQPVLPITLDPGTYYILAEADPDHVVPVTSRGMSIAASPPFVVGVPAPNLSVPSVVVPDTVEPGASFTVSWTAANTGNAPAVRAPYHIVLSTHDTPNLSSRVVHRGILDLEMLIERDIETEITLPTDVATGTYYIGVMLDPDMVVYEHDKSNNVGVSNPMQVSSPDSLAIFNDSNLPAAELGTYYAIALEAIGGDGTYLWGLPNGQRLPPGLYLEETPLGAREAGLPFVTMLAGLPSILGDFEFALEARSAGTSASKTFRIHVGRMEFPLAITTRDLPDGDFQSEYSVPLAAAGGTPPYIWAIDEGRLPGGLTLSPANGKIAGRPTEAGQSDLTVRVTDSAGVSATQNYVLVILPPARITCATESLPPHRINEPYEERLHAAGGTQPVWSNQMIYYLANGPGERWEMHAEQAPPGIVLGQDGRVSGTPTRAGLYDWFVEIKDAAANTNDRTSCAIRVEILRDQNLTVLTRSLPDAVVGQRYSAQLEASGGEGEVRWSIGGDEKLPAGLSLSAEGIITGIPTGTELAGETAGSISFMVRATDPHNRVDIAPLSVTLYALPRGHGPTEDVKTVSSCQSAGAEPSLLLVAAVAGLAAIRRRRRD